MCNHRGNESPAEPISTSLLKINCPRAGRWEGPVFPGLSLLFPREENDQLTDNAVIISHLTVKVSSGSAGQRPTRSRGVAERMNFRDDTALISSPSPSPLSHSAVQYILVSVPKIPIQSPHLQRAISLAFAIDSRDARSSD